MQVLKIIFLVIAIIAVPLVSCVLIRLLLRLARGLSHINKTLDDARPQVNLLLSNLNNTVEGINGELGKVTVLTDQARGMLERTDASLGSVEKALKSRTARYGGIIAAYYATSALTRRILKKSGYGRKAKRMMRYR